MKHSAIPWTLTLLLALYVFGLEYYAENRQPPDPSIEFYDTTTVQVQVHAPDSEEMAELIIYGEFNNILEGERQLVQASVVQGRYELKFKVNSPRSALLYANDETLDVFLIPGDTTLKVDFYWTAPYDRIDSARFEGQAAGICHYYQAKAERFEQMNLRKARNLLGADDFSRYAARLDSMTMRELAFLVEQEIFATLPQWFALFEKTEILYQRAYLKLSAAYNREVPPELLDQAKVNNPNAVFSYYYYLYLSTYFARLEDEPTSALGHRRSTGRHIALADSLLRDGPRDVFMTRLIFQHIREGEHEFAREMLEQYEGSFSQPKYVRFLERQIEESQQKAAREQPPTRKGKSAPLTTIKA